MLIFLILKTTRAMEIRIGETITTAEVEVATSREVVDTSREAVTRITTTKIETAAGEIGVAKAEEATVVAEIREAGVTDGTTTGTGTMRRTMLEAAGETRAEVDMVADTKDKAHTPTMADLISDHELKGHQEGKHQALALLNRRASPADQDVSCM